MSKTFRVLVLSSALAFSAVPMFADGPGTNDPPPPPTTNGSTTSTLVTGTIAAILAYLGL